MHEAKGPALTIELLGDVLDQCPRSSVRGLAQRDRAERCVAQTARAERHRECLRPPDRFGRRRRARLRNEFMRRVEKGDERPIELGRPDAYSLLLIRPGIWYNFMGLGDVPSLIVNCTDKVHDPEEIERVDAPL